jgi:manganese transport protein
MFLSIIACGLFYELLLASPILGDILRGFVPDSRLALDPKLLYLAIGVIGATVMPHNLYLHSRLALNRWQHGDKHKSARMATLDTIISLGSTMLLNSALVVLAASAFHFAGRTDVSDITDAHHLLTPLLGTSTAAIVFAIMLLASGQSATITGTLAGQVVMNGFVQIRMKLWMRRLITRMFALIPTLIILIYVGERGVTKLILGSQVFLSLQLPLAMLSLLLVSSDVRRMGSLVNARWMHWTGWFCAGIIVIANLALIAAIIRY